MVMLFAKRMRRDVGCPLIHMCENTNSYLDTIQIMNGGFISTCSHHTELLLLLYMCQGTGYYLNTVQY
jgi:hypothetical protein